MPQIEHYPEPDDASHARILSCDADEYVVAIALATHMRHEPHNVYLEWSQTSLLIKRYHNSYSIGSHPNIMPLDFKTRAELEDSWTTSLSVITHRFHKTLTF